jgi:hypothetical protein
MAVASFVFWWADAEDMHIPFTKWISELIENISKLLNWGSLINNGMNNYVLINPFCPAVFLSSLHIVTLLEQK